MNIQQLFSDGLRILFSNSYVWIFGFIMFLSLEIEQLFPNKGLLACVGLLITLFYHFGQVGLINSVAFTTQDDRPPFRIIFEKSKSDFWNILIILLKSGFLLILILSILLMINWLIYEVTQVAKLEWIWYIFLLLSILFGLYLLFVYLGVIQFSFCESILKGQNTSISLVNGWEIFRKKQSLYFNLFILLLIFGLLIWGIEILSGIVMIGIDPFVFVQKTLGGDFTPYTQVLSTPFYRIISALFSLLSLPYFLIVETLFYLRVTNYNSSEFHFLLNDPLHQLPPPIS